MRIEQLTFTRFIAAIAIVIFHFGKGIYPFGSGLLSTIINNANVAVSYFFTLSGFVMIIVYGASNKMINAKKYYINRVAKIYPVYFLSLLLMLCNAHDLSYGKLLAEFFLIHSVIPTYLPSYNLPDWSLSVEAFFYLSFPLLFNLFYLKRSKIFIAITLIAIWLLSQTIFFVVSANLYIWPAPYFNFIIYSPVVHFNEFLIGNLTGFVYLYLVRKGHFKKDLSLIVFISLFILCYLMADFKTLGIKPVANLHNGILSAFFAPLILLLALNKGYISKALSFRPLIFLGEISYCIYILQFPVFTFLERFFINSNSTMRFYSLLLILIVISIICYIIIELPGKKYIKIFFKPYLQFKSITDTNDELTGAAKKRDA